MGVPYEVIATGVVVAFAAIIAFFASRSKKEAQKVATDGRRDQATNTQSPIIYMPPSPQPAEERGRRRKTFDRCTNCGKNPKVKIHPCNHESLCKGCAVDHLKDSDTCPTCDGRIDSCDPPIPPFGKCESCKKFTELFKFLPCNHSLSLCVHCFERQMKSYKKCPVCGQAIRGCEPIYSTSGVCSVCGEFVRFAKFKPCGHGNFCESHAKLYLKLNEKECSECGEKATL